MHKCVGFGYISSVCKAEFSFNLNLNSCFDEYFFRRVKALIAYSSVFYRVFFSGISSSIALLDLFINLFI